MEGREEIISEIPCLLRIKYKYFFRKWLPSRLKLVRYTGDSFAFLVVEPNDPEEVEEHFLRLELNDDNLKLSLIFKQDWVSGFEEPLTHIIYFSRLVRLKGELDSSGNPSTYPWRVQGVPKKLLGNTPRIGASSSQDLERCVNVIKFGSFNERAMIEFCRLLEINMGLEDEDWRKRSCSSSSLESVTGPLTGSLHELVIDEE